MAKKGTAVQLQTEVNNDDDWNNLLQKNGLIVADVYSEWCGPCGGMVATLKKVKLELGGDLLQLALVKAEGVTALSRFKGRSEPTWMLIAKGKLANFMFGADAPKLTQLITDELKKEIDAMEGRRERVLSDIEEPTPIEKKRLAKIEAEQRAEEERERQKIEQEVRERRTKECTSILENLSHYGVILVLPNATKRYQEIVNDLLTEAALNITKTEKIYISAEKIEELFYFDENVLFNEQTIDEVQNNESICLIVKPKAGREQTEEIEDILLKLVYGNSKAPPGDENSPAMILARPPLPSKILQGYVQVQPRLSVDDDDIGEDEEEEEENEEEMDEGDEVPKEESQLVPNFLAETREDDEAEGEVEEEEEVEKISLWTPPNAMVKASALKLFATDISSNYILPIPEPTPPHFALVFDIYRRFEIYSLMDKHRQQILNYGFFTDSVPEKAELIAKTLRQYERTPVKPPDAKMVIQLSRKKSECFLTFITLRPNYISPNADEGKRECKLFFPDEYDVKKEEEAEDEEDLDIPADDYLEGAEEVEEEIAEEEEVEEEEDEEEEEGDMIEGDEADFYEQIETYVT